MRLTTTPTTTTTTTTSSIRRRLRVLLVAATAVAVGATLAATATATPASAATTSATLKPVLGGLLDRQREPAAAFQGAVDGHVVEVAWADLQPLANGPLADDNPIDQAITNAHAKGLKLKLRVFAGTSAPDWAKRLDGRPIDVLDDYGRTGTIGRFWTPTFGQAYLQLQRKLAARYDATPELLVTQVTRCTTIWSELFLRQGRTTESVQNLLDAGFTATLDEQCHRDQVNAHKLWTTTRSGLSFNPYQRILADTTIKNDTVFSEQMMDYCRTQLGPRCVLENHSIRDTQNQGPSYDRLYSMLDARGGAIAFQTAAPHHTHRLQPPPQHHRHRRQHPLNHQQPGHLAPSQVATPTPTHRHSPSRSVGGLQPMSSPLVSLVRYVCGRAARDAGSVDGRRR